MVKPLNSMPTDDNDRKPVSLEINMFMHEQAKEIARRKKWHLTLVYEDALRHYFELPENYLGSDK